jgi:hypothetical protein
VEDEKRLIGILTVRDNRQPLAQLAHARISNREGFDLKNPPV